MALIAFPSVAKTVRLGHQIHQPQSVLTSEYSGQRHTMRLGEGRWAGTARIVVDTLTPAAIQQVLTWIGALADGANWTNLPLGVPPILADPADPDSAFVSGFIHDGTRLRMKHNTAAEGDSPAFVYTPAVPALSGSETQTAATHVNAFWRARQDGFGPMLDRSPDWIEDFEFPWIERLTV